jgi:hypothetical protein
MPDKKFNTSALDWKALMETDEERLLKRALQPIVHAGQNFGNDVGRWQDLTDFVGGPTSLWEC